MLYPNSLSIARHKIELFGLILVDIHSCVYCVYCAYGFLVECRYIGSHACLLLHFFMYKLQAYINMHLHRQNLEWIEILTRHTVI